ncbi:hypothetical protein B0H11DRAFT_2217990 [Mycena galericulata]|nr:hypothetical protein B0H11DRAFT_2217990 [Mycena galericulata]
MPAIAHIYPAFSRSSYLTLCAPPFKHRPSTVSLPLSCALAAVALLPLAPFIPRPALAHLYPAVALLPLAPFIPRLALAHLYPTPCSSHAIPHAFPFLRHRSHLSRRRAPLIQHRRASLFLRPALLFLLMFPRSSHSAPSRPSLAAL